MQELGEVKGREGRLLEGGIFSGVYSTFSNGNHHGYMLASYPGHSFKNQWPGYEVHVQEAN